MNRQDQQLDQLHIEALAGYCAEASKQGKRDKLVYCYEMFRRAFDEADQQAWGAVSRQYHALICSWVIKFAAEPLDEREVGDLARDALAKFWRTLLSKRPLGNYFSHTPELLAYLNRCTVSTVHDVSRRLKAQQRVATIMAQQPVAMDASLENVLVADNEAETHVKLVRQWVDTHVTDPVESQLLELIFGQGLKPREIVVAYPQQFPDIRTVRRVRERVLKRARRSPLFQDIHD